MFFLFYGRIFILNNELPSNEPRTTNEPESYHRYYVVQQQYQFAKSFNNDNGGHRQLLYRSTD